MRRVKKKTVIIILIFIGIVVLGGTAYGVVQSNNLKEAKLKIEEEQNTLDTISLTLASYQTEGGYLTEDATMNNIEEIRNSLHSIKDSYADYQVKKDAIKNEIATIKADKKAIEEQLNELGNKLELQTAINALYTDRVLSNEGYKEVAIIKNLTDSDLSNVEKLALKKKDDDDFYKAVTDAVVKAKGQLDQIKNAEGKVYDLIEDEKVVEKADRKGYDLAKTEVDKIKNKEVVKQFNKDLAIVLKEVERKEAEARLKAEAEEQAQKQSQQSSNNSSKSNNTGDNKNSSSSQNPSNGNKKSSKESGGDSSSKGFWKDGYWIVEETEIEYIGEILNDDGTPNGGYLEGGEFELSREDYCKMLGC